MSERFGHYEIEALLGVGGMGEVYRARDTRRDREVALKLLPELFTADGEFEARFRRESLVAARLREPHIVPIHDFGDIGGRLFIDMRLVDGTDLGTLVHQTGPLPPERAVALIAQVADALDAAHGEQLVHRDIKPSNVLVTEHDFVYVVDFGIARSIGSTRATALTITGATIGTLDYMAPERFTNAPIDGRADVYSLACVLYECLTGSRPFPGDDLPSLMYAHLYTTSKHPSDVVDGIPPALDEVLATGMAKDREDRYPTAGEFAAAARAALTAAPSVPESTAPQTVVVPRPVYDPVAGGSPLPPPPPARGGTTDPAQKGPGRSVGRRLASAAGALAAAAGLVFVTTLIHHPHDAMATASQQDPTTTAGQPGHEGHTGDMGDTGDMGGSAKSGDGTAASRPDPGVGQDIPAGQTPGFIGMAPDGSFAYICNRAAGVISVLDPARKEVVGTIPVPQGPPQYVAFSPDGKTAFVSVFDDNGHGNEVLFVDTRTSTIFDELHLGVRPFALTVSPDGKRLWVPSHDENKIYVIDIAGRSLLRTVDVAPNPHWVAISPDGKTAYAANHDSNEITVIDTTTFATLEIPAGMAPHSTAVSPDGSLVAVVDFMSNEVTVVDAATNTVRTTIPVGANPQDVAFAPDGKHFYTVNNADNSVSVIDTGTLTEVDRVAVDSPTSIAISPDGATAYVTSLNTGTVRVLDLAG